MRSVPSYSDGFLRAWGAYPHFGQRSVKLKAFEVWRKAELEPHADAVVAWIEAGKRGADWIREEGKFVQGMQVWLKGRDFSELPTKPAPIAQAPRPTLPWDSKNRLLTPEELEERRRRESGARGQTA